MDSAELRSRTKALAVTVIRFVEGLKRNPASDVIGKQLIRSATSVAANYRAACRARSKADFANKMGIIEEEADETLFWLEMLVECEKAKNDDVKSMMDEAEQLLRIFAASRMTAKANAASK
jgi:four helix bundle protein